MIEQQPFVRYKTDEEKAKEKGETFTVRINEDERKDLDACKIIMQQPKDSTVLKQLAKIGIYSVLHDDRTRFIIAQIFINKRNNERTGIPIDELKI